mmetsp:Transcript_32238/g.108571  ORF Transcript_32238/g.108571 Transcript_32238/m.108571 type:complete len:238 (+) Transcript_32238:2700-3413(+)
MRSMVTLFASSCFKASSGKLRRAALALPSKSAIWRRGVWNHQTRFSTALARFSSRSASDGQCARSAISKSARQTRAAFLATYAPSDASVNVIIGAREMCACSSVAALPAGSSATPSSSDSKGAELEDSLTLSLCETPPRPSAFLPAFWPSGLRAPPCCTFDERPAPCLRWLLAPAPALREMGHAAGESRRRSSSASSSLRGFKWLNSWAEQTTKRTWASLACCWRRSLNSAMDSCFK